MGKISLNILTLLFVPLLLAAQPAKREFKSFEQDNGTLIINVSDGHYELMPFNEKIIHTSFYPEGKKPDNFSFAVAMKPTEVEYTVSRLENLIEVSTGGIDIRITKEPFNVSYHYNDKTLISERRGFVQTDSTHKLDFSITGDEVLYGGGTRVLGMDRRGHRLKIYNQAHYGYTTHSELMNYALPVFLSSKQYAVLFDNASLAWLDLDSKNDNSLNYETIGGIPNYHVIAGDDWYDVVEQYTTLTGRQPIPPRWSLGNFSSRFGYHTQSETDSTVQQFFKDSIPLDAVVIDLYWFGPDIFDYMGNLDWWGPNWPEPQKMMAEFEEKGVKTILVTEPFILTTSKRWDEAVEENILGTDSAGKPYTYDFYFGNTGLIDIFKPKARWWFWDKYKDLTEQGVGGWWGDLGEPEVHPSGLQQVNGSADEVHNAYGHEWAGVVYNGYQKDFPDTRPFILMRAGYAGSQRYGMIPWTGDVSRSWGGLKPQPEISLQMGMQGLAYMHSDLGGFAGGDTLDRELYIRWLQYGVFQPIYRPHAQEEIPSEPVFWNDTTKAHARRSIELRYKLLPYIYTMTFENHKTGKPLMIPLFFNHPENRELLTYDESYMWGDALLVSPVKERGKKSQKVYLPDGSQWIDFYSGKSYQGGQHITVPLTIDHIPVFAKGGSFVPMKKEGRSTMHYDLKEFDIHFYFDKSQTSSDYTLYHDDGKTPAAYEKGKFETITFRSKQEKDALAITINPDKGDAYGKTENKQVRFFIENYDRKPRKITINKKKLTRKNWYWNPEKKQVVLTLTVEENAKEIRIR
ncbi:MAG: DUF5110 domain-containing protein [Bacteroidales bacterium]|nr:DUF5110 domain-containing protein [Bacteroidales bacterium]